MDDLLKRLAALDDTTLTVYTLLDPNYKKPRKPRAKRVKETSNDSPNLPPRPENPESIFNFNDWATQYESLCEADFQLSKMTEDELEELGYFEQMSESDSETESQFNTDALKSDSEIRNDWREAFFRTDRCTENAPNRVTTKYIDLFNQLALKNIFIANLRSSPDDVIKTKLTKFPPLITAKCFIELYSGVKDHVKNHISVTESIFNEMKSIWSRARTYYPLTDLASDFRRLRNLKIKQPDCSLRDIQEGFAVRNEIHEFLDKSDVHDEIVREAGKRIGADKYGSTIRFAEIIDETNLSEEEEPLTLVTDVTVDINTISNDTDYVNNTASTDDNNPVLSPSELSKKDISKLHRAIKKALKNKLSK